VSDNQLWVVYSHQAHSFFYKHFLSEGLLGVGTPVEQLDKNHSLRGSYIGQEGIKTNPQKVELSPHCL
jgi:hypothetical protein